MAEIEAKLRLVLKQEVGDRIDSLASSISDLTNSIEALRIRPMRRKIEAQGNSLAGTSVIVDLGTPNQGREWDLRQVTVSGADPTTAVAGTVCGYRGEASRPYDLVDRSPLGVASPIPYLNNWGEGRIVVNSGMHLFYVVTGLGNNIQILVSVFAYDRPEGSTGSAKMFAANPIGKDVVAPVLAANSRRQ